MRKSRTLAPNLGDHPYGKYHNFGESGVLTGTSGNNYDVCCSTMLGQIFTHKYQGWSKTCPSDYLGWYNKHKALAVSTSSLPTEIGEEVFESTTRPKPYYNSCAHSKVQGFNVPFLLTVEYTGSLSMKPYFKWAIPTQTFANNGALALVNWNVFEGAQRRAWWSMQPRFETEIQLLNFIYELKDFKRMAKHLMNFQFSKLGIYLRNLKGKLREGLPRTSGLSFARMTLADITRTTAEARLVNEFAIKPLISDLTAMFTTIASVIELTQQQFADRGALHQVSHYSEEGPFEKTGIYGTRFYTPRFTGNVQQSLFTATLQYSYKYDLRKGWDLLKRSMGLEFNAEVFWNMIPFSFLVDYIYKIGAAFHTMNTDPNVEMRMLQYSESIMQTRTSGHHIDKGVDTCKAAYAPTSMSPYSQLIPINGCGESLYRRRLVSPNKGAAMPRFKKPSEGQLWNMAALLRCFFD